MLVLGASAFELSITFFLQMAAILGAIRVVGLAARWLGQPQVVGEMITGVLLGPSLLGWLAPGLSDRLFPRFVEVAGVKTAHPLMIVLYCCAQLGLVLYMFIVGMEFRTDIVRNRLRGAASISLAGVLTPFALAALIAWTLPQRPSLFAPHVGLGEATLFLGAAMSITAFPMLARIIVERGIANTRVGTLSLAAGSIDDALAWCILAGVLASVQQNASLAWIAVGGGLLYALFVLGALRPLLRGVLSRAASREGGVSYPVLGLVAAMLMIAAWYTDFVGIYAVFGAFMLGLAMPRGAFVEQTRAKLEPATVAVLLPLFFVYSGLNTRLTLLNTPGLWGVALLLLAASCAAKFAACALAARASGENWRDAGAIGALMNSRGLMELILLNIGREHGVITDELFGMLVLMAVVTTLLATPLFNLVMRGYTPKSIQIPA